jgi:hypothetical protein
MTRYRTLTADLAAHLPVPVVTPREPVRPPAIIVTPGSPWLVPLTACAPLERYDVLVVAGEIDRKAIDLELDDMLELTLTAIAAADLELIEAGPPTVLELGGVQHLAITVTVTTP